MNIYLLNDDYTEIVAGPFSVYSEYSKKITGHSNPEVLTIEELYLFRLVPETIQEITDHHSYKHGAPYIDAGTVIVPSIQLTQEEMLANVKEHMTNFLQNLLDEKAKERNYDGILSLCSYATSSDPIFAAEGQAGVVWRDAVWRAGYNIMADVLAGTRQIPTEEQLITELPTIQW